MFRHCIRRTCRICMGFRMWTMHMIIFWVIIVKILINSVQKNTRYISILRIEEKKYYDNSLSKCVNNVTETWRILNGIIKTLSPRNLRRKRLVSCGSRLLSTLLWTAEGDGRRREFVLAACFDLLLNRRKWPQNWRYSTRILSTF